jgi:2-polyprenyl-3-methyl-5-hydroxy-6-metoxy-1,4-benzoquinol methylase
VNCYICYRPTTSFLYEKTDTIYHNCKECEFIFKSPKHYLDFQAQKKRYELHENNENDIGYRAYFERFLDYILYFVGKPKEALDFGCGCTTLLSNMIEQKGINCDYYDPIFYPDGMKDKKIYDVIVSVEVFEHLQQPDLVFKDLLNRLGSGGYLAIQTEFHPNNIEKFKKWWYHNDPTHIVFFRAKTFKVLAKKHGVKFIASNDKNIAIVQKI